MIFFKKGAHKICGKYQTNKHITGFPERGQNRQKKYLKR